MILQKIIAHKKVELASCKEKTPLKALEESLPGSPAPRPFAPALRRRGQVAIIAEAKKASPSKGILCQDFDPVKIALEYEQAGAAAISVLTEEKFFLGQPSYLTQVRQATGIPVLRKDFIIDPYQIYESRVLGADAVLLIAAVLSGEQLAELRMLAASLGMSSLVEVHTEMELALALSAGADIIGINNRDLNTFETDLNKTFSLLGLINDKRITVVSESGIKTHADIMKLKEGGVHAALVGEALVRSADPGEALKELLNCPCGDLERGTLYGSP